MSVPFSKDGVVTLEKAAEIMQCGCPSEYVISFEFAEKLVALSNEGHKASPHEVAAVMARLREVLDGR